MKFAAAVLVLFAALVTETFAYHNVQSYYIPSVSYGSSSGNEYDNNLKYRKSIDANQSGRKYYNDYYSRPSYYYPGSQYYDYDYGCGYGSGCNYPNYYYSRPEYYGSSSGSEYNDYLKYRESLDKSSRGRRYRNKYYNGPSDWWY